MVAEGTASPPTLKKNTSRQLTFFKRSTFLRLDATPPLVLSSFFDFLPPMLRRLGDVLRSSYTE